MILKQKNLHIFSKFFFVSVHFLITDTCKCVSWFTDVDPENLFSKKLLGKCLCAIAAGQTVYKSRMNMQYIGICK